MCASVQLKIVNTCKYLLNVQANKTDCDSVIFRAGLWRKCCALIINIHRQQSRKYDLSEGKGKKNTKLTVATNISIFFSTSTAA